MEAVCATMVSCSPRVISLNAGGSELLAGRPLRRPSSVALSASNRASSKRCTPRASSLGHNPNHEGTQLEPEAPRSAAAGGPSSRGDTRLHVWATAVARNYSEEDVEECEVVNGREVVLGDVEGARPEEKFGGYLVHPLKNNNGTGVLVLPDVLGHATMEIREFAYRLACFGYSVLVTDLFRGQPWDEARPKEQYEAWRAQHAADTDRVLKDVETASAFLREHLLPEGTHSTALEHPRMAVLGFCYGGGRVLETLATDATQKFQTGVCFYGTRFDPSAVASKIKVPVLFITGDQDPLCPVESFEQVAAKVRGSNVLVFPGRGHAFAHRPASMDEDEDAEQAFQTARHWVHDFLVPVVENQAEA